MFAHIILFKQNEQCIYIYIVQNHNAAVDWNQFNTGSNPVPIEALAKYDHIDYLWVINPLKSR